MSFNKFLCYALAMKKIYTLLIIMLAFAVSAFAKTDIKNNDYSKPENWLSMPAKTDYPVDVFYIYPTTCMSKNFIQLHKCEIDNEDMRFHARKVFNLQAKVFDTAANIYAPFYTQLGLASFLNMDFSGINSKVASNEQEISDIYNSLDYYFKNKNNNRPFILASHSQGSSVMLLVLSDYMKKHPEYYKNMVAAYVIGVPVTKQYMKANPHLKFARKKDDTGVIISYNTQAPSKTGANIVYQKDSLVINPISWSRFKSAPQSKNLGSIDEFSMKIISPGLADAKTDRKKGIIVCSTTDVKKYEIPMPEFFGHGSYHGQDYQFYFMNLRQNAKDRINRFLSSKK